VVSGRPSRRPPVHLRPLIERALRRVLTGSGRASRQSRKNGLRLCVGVITLPRLAGPRRSDGGEIL
jgi:hypothetical protein